MHWRTATYSQTKGRTPKEGPGIFDISHCSFVQPKLFSAQQTPAEGRSALKDHGWLELAILQLAHRRLAPTSCGTGSHLVVQHNVDQ
jgi:hypothetical protein